MPELNAGQAAYLTDRKRAVGTGSAGSGTAHFWRVTISSAALVFLMPLFVFTFGRVVGEPYEVVRAYYAQPFPAIVALLTFLVGMHHFKDGVRVLITDYSRGLTRKGLIVVATCLSYAVALIGVFCVIRLAL